MRKVLTDAPVYAGLYRSFPELSNWDVIDVNEKLDIIRAILLEFHVSHNYAMHSIRNIVQNLISAFPNEFRVSESIPEEQLN